MNNMTQVNELPQGWKWVRLGDVCHIEMGQSPNGDSYNKNTNGLPLLNGPAEFGKLNPTPVQWTTEPTKLAEKGDILFCVRGSTTGRKNIADRCYCVGRGIASIRGVINKSDTTFLYLLLDQITEELLLKTSGSTFPNLSGENLKKFEIPFPELPEQQRLATLLTAKLSLIERAKEKITAQLQAAQELTAAYLREVFESEEAKGWEWVKLGDIAIKISKGESPEWQGFSYTNHGIRFIRSENIQWGSFSDIKKTFIPLEFHNKLTRSKVTGGDILINLVGASIGRVCKCPDNIESANINQAVAVISLSNYNSDFLVNFILTNKIQEHFKNVQVDVARPNISLTNLRDLPIPSISTDKQTQLTNYLSEKLATVEQLKTTLQTQLDSINQLPAALLKQAFNGQL